MEVLMKVGIYAGEIRDLRPDCARQMIADGQAIDPHHETAEEVEPIQARNDVPKRKARGNR